MDESWFIGQLLGSAAHNSPATCEKNRDGQHNFFGKPLTSTLLTSASVFRSEGFPFGEFEWSLVASSLEGFSVSSHETGVPSALFTGIERVQEELLGTRNQGGHVKRGL